MSLPKRLVVAFPLGLALVFALVALLVPGCGDDSSSPASGSALAATWGGRLDGTDAFVGIASNGTEIRAYVCDGTTVAEWFEGDAADRIDISGNGHRLTAELGEDLAKGTVTIDGKAIAFTAERLSGDNGLYRHEEPVDGKARLSGWIVLSPDEIRGATVSPSGAITRLVNLTTAARLVSINTPY